MYEAIKLSACHVRNLFRGILWVERHPISESRHGVAGPDRYLQGFIVDYVRLKDMHIVQTLRGSRQMGSFTSVPHDCEHCALGSCCLYEKGLSDNDVTSWLDSDCKPTHQLADVLEADAPRGSDDSICWHG